MPVLSRILASQIFWVALLPSLAAQQQFQIDVAPVGQPLLTVDIDGDSLPDLLTSQDEQLVLYRNLGHGRYAAPLTISPPGLRLSWRIAAGDFDGDSDVDFIAIAAWNLSMPANEVYLLAQNNLSFTATVIGQLPTTGNVSPLFVRALDLEGDGDMDVVVGGQGGPLSSQAVLQNNGGGAFTNVTTQWLAGIGFVGHEVIDIDVDGDGLRDLFYGTATGGSRVLRNAGTHFVDETAMRLGGLVYYHGLVAGDVDGDGDTDVMAMSTTLLLRNQGGTFAPAPFPAIPGLAYAWALLDVEGDGDLDACIVDSSTGQSFFTINNGNGTFGAPTVGPILPTDTGNMTLIAMDQDGDGDQDLMLFGRKIAQMFGDGAGNFVARQWSPDLPQQSGIAADIDGDGDLDLFTATAQLRYEQNGRYSVHPTSGPSELPLFPGQIGDVDGDGDLDIVTNAVYLNDGAGNFTVNPASGFPGNSFGTGTLADIDQDGDLDIVAIFGPPLSTSIVLYVNNGSGTFSVGPTLSTGPAFRLSIADANADGRPDIVVIPLFSAGSRVLLNTSGGIVTMQLPPSSASRAEFAQFGGSALPDLILFDGSMRIFRQQAGGFVEVTASTLPAGFTGFAAIGDYDGDGDLDFVGTDLLENDGSGNFTLVRAGFPSAPTTLADLDGDRDLDAITTTGVYFNRERQLLVSTPAKIGQSIHLEISSRPGRASLDFAMLGLAFSSRSFGLQGPLGLLFVDAPLVTQLLPIPNVAGELSYDIPLPNQQGLIGLEVHMQTLHGNPYSIGLGNLAIVKIE